MATRGRGRPPADDSRLSALGEDVFAFADEVDPFLTALAAHSQHELDLIAALEAATAVEPLELLELRQQEEADVVVQHLVRDAVARLLASTRKALTDGGYGYLWPEVQRAARTTLHELVQEGVA